MDTNEVKYSISTMTDNKKYLSLIVTARNDDHGGNMLHRMQVCVNGLAYQCKKYNIDAELIVVEWNPLPDKKKLYEVFDWPESLSPLVVRFIEVPEEIHDQIKNSDKIHFFQMISKNAGIRRAKGEFILATNIDILFSDELAQFFACESLEPNYFYRIDRYDVGSKTIPMDISFEEQLDFCQNDVIRIHGLYSTRNPYVPDVNLGFKVHDNACGDFMLMARDKWFSLKGYPELPLWSIHIDTLNVHMAHASGLHQIILPDPMRIYHIEHKLSWAITQDPSKKYPSLDWGNDVVPLLSQMTRHGRPIYFNDDNWGLAQHSLKEHVYVIGESVESHGDIIPVETTSTLAATVETTRKETFQTEQAIQPLTIFTIPKAFKGHIGVIQRNALMSWKLLNPQPEIILFGDDEGTAEIAQELGFRHIPHVRQNEYGTPLLNDIFLQAQDIASHEMLVFINADIILTGDFMAAVNRARMQFDNFLMVGQRWEMDISQLLDFENPLWEKDLSELVHQFGSLQNVTAIDYFVFTRHMFPEIPPFGIGRMAWDNWIIFKALVSGYPVIDATQSVMIVHQNHDYSHIDQSRMEIEIRQNRSLGFESFFICFISHATWKLSRAGLIPKPLHTKIISLCTEGVNFLKNGKPELALEQFDEVLSIGLPVPGIFYARASALLQLSRMQEANLALLAELVTIPYNERARNLLREISDSSQATTQTEESKSLTVTQQQTLTSIIILLSGRREYSKKCVESILKHTKEPHEVIFVPYGSLRKPAKWLRKLVKENKNFRLIKTTPPHSPPYQGGVQGGGVPYQRGVQGGKQKSINNIINPHFGKGGQGGISRDGFLSEHDRKYGFAEACNRGIQLSSGEYIVLLDDSVMVTEDWLTGMIECLNSSADTGIIGPLTVNVEGNQSVPVFNHLSPEHLDEYANAFRKKNRYRRVPAKNLEGFCMLFRRELTEKIGLFDEHFGMHEYANVDYCFRAAMEGFRNIIAGDVFVYFYGHKSAKKDRLDSPSSLIKDRRIFGEKWRNLTEFKPESRKEFCTNILFLAGDLLQKGQKENAVICLVEGIKMYSGDERLHYALAEILIEERKFKEALDILEHMPEEMKKGVKALELTGTCREGMLQFTEAEQCADEILRLNQANPKAWNLKGTIAFARRLFPDAERFFRKAIESDMGFGEAYSNIGALRWQSGKKEEAFTLFEKAFILSPVSEDIVTNYYASAIQLSKLPEAEKAFREAIALYPLNRRLKFIFIDNLLQQEKFHEAMNEMESALITFGIDDDSLTVALNIRDKVGAEEIRRKTIETREDLKKTETYRDSSRLMETSEKKISPPLTGGDKGEGEAISENHPHPTPPPSRGRESVEDSPSRGREILGDTISLCMIVKNEEKHIAQTLQSAKPVVDEMIVVDTGSTDRTQKIARAFGAKVYVFEWTDSFSDARNFSLSKASGKWIFILDGDEVISPLDHGKLRELVTPPSPTLITKNSPLEKGDKENSPLTKGDKGGCKTCNEEESKKQPPAPPFLRGNPSGQGGGTAYSFVSRNYVGPVSVNWHPNDGKYREEAGSGWFPSVKVRLFPNDSRVRFERPVHEMVEDSLLRIGIEFRKCDIPIHHYGKLSREEIRAKGEDYYQMGKKKLAERGERDPNALYELAIQASELEKYDEALEYWEKLIVVKPDFAKAHHGMGTCHFELGRYQEALSSYKRALQLDPDSKDPGVMYATCELLIGNADAAVSYLEELLRKQRDYPLALLALTAACFCAGRKDKGLEYLKKAGATQFSIGPYLNDIAKLLCKVKRFDYAVRLLEASVESKNITNETYSLLAECRKMLRSQ